MTFNFPTNSVQGQTESVFQTVPNGLWGERGQCCRKNPMVLLPLFVCEFGMFQVLIRYLSYWKFHTYKLDTQMTDNTKHVVTDRKQSKIALFSCSILTFSWSRDSARMFLIGGCILLTRTMKMAACASGSVSFVQQRIFNILSGGKDAERLFYGLQVVCKEIQKKRR